MKTNPYIIIDKIFINLSKILPLQAWVYPWPCIPMVERASAIGMHCPLSAAFSRTGEGGS
jgi:hypothetical protein